MLKCCPRIAHFHLAEHHPYLVQKDLVKLAQSQKITVMAYSSFGPFSFRELDWKRANECPLLFEHKSVLEIAKKHNRTAAEVLLRWSTQQGIIVIPKATDPELVRQNLGHIQFDLTKEEIQAIDDLDVGMRFNNPADVRLRAFRTSESALICFVLYSTLRSTSFSTSSLRRVLSGICRRKKCTSGCITSCNAFSRNNDGLHTPEPVIIFFVRV